MHPYAKVFKLYLRQANPSDLSKALPGKRLQLKTIATGLRDIKESICYCMNALQYFFSGDTHCYYQETVSKKLTSSTVLLEGLLDALIICALAEDTQPSHRMSFRVHDAFENPRLCSIQIQVKNLKSFYETNNSSYADLRMIADFRKHYLPCLPLPKEFPNRRIDFQIELGLGKSGPILHDLIVPAFNNACDMVTIIGQELGMEKDDYIVEKIQS